MRTPLIMVVVGSDGSMTEVFWPNPLGDSAHNGQNEGNLYDGENFTVEVFEVAIVQGFFQMAA